jgi:hypothetical protein
LSEQRRKNWLTDLEPPGMMRRLEILSAFPEHKITAEAQKRMVRAANPRPKARLPCHICGRHHAISQSHHVIEIGKVVKVLNALTIYDWAPSIPTVVLCPNHHAYEHVLRRAKKAQSEDSLGLDELSEPEWDRLIEMDDTRVEAHDRVWREVREDFLRREAASGAS